MLINAGPPFKGEANNLRMVLPLGRQIIYEWCFLEGESNFLFSLCIMLFKRFVSFNNAAHDFVTHHILLAELNHANSGHIT